MELSLAIHGCFVFFARVGGIVANFGAFERTVLQTQGI